MFIEMSSHCQEVQGIIDKHKETLKTKEQRETFAAIEHILVRNYIPTTSVITNPFAVNKIKPTKSRKRKNVD